jgi:hypothetical protein
LLRRTSLKARWGLDFGYLPLASEKPGQSETLEAVNRTELALPESLEWHSSTIFTNLPAAWHVVYARGTNPVVVERKFGAGTIVMATDSYFLSNEALLKDRHPDLLAWWVGPNKQIIFDEAHFGILETSGVAKLIRKYHLQGLIAGLILLAALFIWKNSCSFVPPYEEEERPDFVVGKDSAAGFVNLLRRNVPGRKLLEVCFEEWKKSFAQTGPRAAEKQARAQAVLTAENAGAQREHEQVQTYREICNILKKT